ncbi:Hypothetical protein, conserved [Brucella abortus str. 2308 A]|uniref:Uncharacterized protein n=1 Tax=Brucella ceti str. Cudo TaxID=595497 RepID=C0G988_9HYPH|nr:Hypothetical protein, conserved [Brucella ceti str. Cudo]EEP61676.1 Hypothetical protein, conserved [Brucella abortus str. 2308 A]EFG35813.1 conserved hypothetical protein [Brucella sp. NVSL 07-0026]
MRASVFIGFYGKYGRGAALRFTAAALDKLRLKIQI